MTYGPEFEIGPGPDEPFDEDLPNPAPRGSSRLRAIAAVLVAAAVVALVAFRIASTHHSAPAAARRTPAPVRSSAVSAPRGRHTDLPSTPSSSPPPFRTCPSGRSPGSSCLVSSRVARSVTDAILDRFPRAHHIRQLDVELRGDLGAPPRLYYREIHARVDDVQISITVSRRAIEVPEEVAAAPNILSYSYYSRAGLHVTSVGIALGYRWRLLPATRMFALTSDPRLRALSRPDRSH